MLRNGKIIAEEISILARKFALTKICKDLLINQKVYMRITSDQEYSKFAKEELMKN